MNNYSFDGYERGIKKEKIEKKKKEGREKAERARELDRQGHTGDDSIAITVLMGSIRVPAPTDRGGLGGGKRTEESSAEMTLG